MKDKKTANDLLLIAGAILIALIALIICNQYKKRTTENAYVVIEINGEEIGRYSLNENRELELETYNGGSNIVVIKDNEVTVTEASCPDKICVNHKAIKYNGETIICLPNRMTVTIESTGEKTDGKTY
ncbi:MAG: NusG domain II-containing protein [Lachnospiraceae bacterium]|nr:NusG domain II-containing protein [Lachnospiraceae bacterium]